jgi:hypothetical protein
MRNGFLGSLAGVLVAAGIVVAQPAQIPTMSPSATPDPEPATEITPVGDETALPAPQPMKTDDAAPPAGSKDEPLLPAPRPTGPTDQAGPAEGVQPRVGVPDESVSSFPKEMAGAWMGGPYAPPQLTVRGDYLLWWLKNAKDLPSIVNGQFLNVSGDATEAGGQGANVNYGIFSGARLTLDYLWDTGCGCYGVNGNIFFVGRQSLFVRVDSDVLLGRLFSDIIRGGEEFIPLTVQGLSHGSFTGTATAELWGAQLNGLINVINDPIIQSVRFDLLAGLRFAELSEDLTLNSITAFNRDLTAFPDQLAFAGNTIRVFDNFLTRNRFFGAQAGMLIKFYLDFMVIDLGIKAAAGTTYEEISIQGSQVRSRPNGTTTISQGGLFALPSNIGHFHREQFALMPELDINVAIPLGSHLSFKGGFTAFYWNRVVRPENNIDRHIDVNQLPNFGGAPNQATFTRPTVPFVQSQFYAGGFTFGLEFKW